jgi:hypothetical protein
MNNILHIYGQNYEHDNAIIIGNKSALKRLKDNINIALEEGKYMNTDNCYSDFVDCVGKEYDVAIYTSNFINNKGFSLPYKEIGRLCVQLIDIKDTLTEYEDDPKKCIEEIKKILKEE